MMIKVFLLQTKVQDPIKKNYIFILIRGTSAHMLHPRKLLYYITHTYHMYKVHYKMSILVHFNGDCFRKYRLPGRVYESTTFQPCLLVRQSNTFFQQSIYLPLLVASSLGGNGNNYCSHWQYCPEPVHPTELSCNCSILSPSYQYHIFWT